MAEHPERERITEREHTIHVTERSRGTGIAAVVGGLVVAVLLLFWLIGGFERGDPEVSETAVTVVETETTEETEVTTGAEAPDMATGTESETTPETNGETTPASEPERAAEQPADEPAATE